MIGTVTVFFFTWFLLPYFFFHGLVSRTASFAVSYRVYRVFYRRTWTASFLPFYFPSRRVSFPRRVTPEALHILFFYFFTIFFFFLTPSFFFAFFSLFSHQLNGNSFRSSFFLKPCFIFFAEVASTVQKCLFSYYRVFVFFTEFFVLCFARVSSIVFLRICPFLRNFRTKRNLCSRLINLIETCYRVFLGDVSFFWFLNQMKRVETKKNKNRKTNGHRRRRRPGTSTS